MYTSMDCEFFENTYYYDHLSSQGENDSDDLSWLTYPVTVVPDPPELVGNTIEVSLHPLLRKMNLVPPVPISSPLEVREEYLQGGTI